MQIQRLEVENWRCFENEAVQFENGVTVLYGNNGAGKTSLLEAAFFALYGTAALRGNTTMDDVVTTDEKTAKVVLTFEHRGNPYEVSREIRIRQSTYQEAQLTTPAGKPNPGKINDIDSLIQEELRLNAEDFLNSAYVRQGDVAQLIEATPKQRQRIIDNLLQMSKLERYRDRTGSIETGIGRVSDSKEGRIEELTDQIAEYDEPQLRARKRQLEEFEAELNEKADSLDDKIEELEGKLEQAKDKIHQQGEFQKAIEEAETEIESLTTELAAEVAEYQNHRNDLDDAKQDIEQYHNDLESLLTVGTGDLSTESTAATQIRTAIENRAEELTTEPVAGDESPTKTGETASPPDTEPAEVAAAVLKETGVDNSDGEPTDSFLDGLDISLPDASPAVTGESIDDDIDTVGTVDVIASTEVEPIINPSVTAAVESVRVPTAGIDGDSESLSAETAVDTEEQTEGVVEDIREQIQAIEAAIDETRESARTLEDEQAAHNRDQDEQLAEASDVLSEVAGIRSSREILATKRDELRTETSDFAVEIEPTDEDPRQALQRAAAALAARLERLKAERKTRQERATKLGERIDQADRLLEAGKCPECGRPVDGAPNVEHRAEWESERATLQDLIELMDSDITDLETRLKKTEQLLDRADNLYADADTVTVTEASDGEAPLTVDVATDLRELYEDAAEAHLHARKEREAAQAKHQQAVRNHLVVSLLERAAERTVAQLHRARARAALNEEITATVSDRDDAEQQQELAQNKLTAQASTVADIHNALCEQIARHSDAASQFDPEILHDAESKIEDTSTEIDAREQEQERIQTVINKINTDLGRFEQELSKLESLREKLTTREQEAKAVAALQDQVENLKSMFVELREDLRKQNVERLEELLQAMFDTLYRNGAFADIKLDEDYDATLIEKQGGELSPGKLSGGESAIFNLALRGAIYRLLTEGFEDDVPLPPLILDEPTAHLDAGHVERLDNVVEAMRTAGVKQTIVVSHDKEIIDSADHRIHIRRQKGTNRSVAEVEEEIPLGA